MKRAGPSEDDIQTVVADFLRAMARPGVIWWHTPNQGYRDIRYARKLSRMGVKAGVPDIIVLLPEGGAAFLELKSETGKPTKDQREFLKGVSAMGHDTAVATSSQQAIDWLISIGATNLGKPR